MKQIIVLIVLVYIETLANSVELDELYSDANCGHLKDPTKVADYGWLAMVMVKNSKSGKFCYANFITPQWLLGAAACISDRIPLANYTLRFPKSISTMEIDKIIKSPKFNPTLGAGYDLSLIKLKRAITFEKTGLRPICLANYDINHPTKIVDNCYNISGSRIDLVDDKCQDIFPNIYKPEYMACGDQANCLAKNCKANCGTNGAPIICQNSMNRSRWYLAAMASWGRDCSKEELIPQYDVYTKFYGENNYINWINSTIHPHKN